MDGLSIFYRDGHLGATEKAVVLLHGIGVSGRYMVPLAHELAARCRVLVPDLPGFGLTQKPAVVFGIDALADLLERWLLSRNVRSAVLVGNSFGCQVALALASKSPDRVDRLLLQAPTMDPAARQFNVLAGRWLRNIRRESISLLPVMARDLLDCGPGRIVKSLRYAFDDEPEEKVSTLRMPILVVRGKDDQIVSHRWASELAARAPRGELLEIPGAHALNFSHPAELAAIITDFAAG